MKWINRTYLRCIPLCFGVWLVSCLAFLHNHCYSLNKTKWGLVISIWQGPEPFATRTPYFRRNSNPQQIVSANSHPGDVSNFKCKLANKRVVTGTGRKPYVPRRPAQMARFDGEILKVFKPISQRGRRGFPLSQELKKIAVDLNFGENMAFLLVQDPALSKWPVFTSSYDGSNNGYAVKPRKSVKRQSDTKTQWNTSLVRPFYSFHWRENWI